MGVKTLRRRLPNRTVTVIQSCTLYGDAMHIARQLHIATTVTLAAIVAVLTAIAMLTAKTIQSQNLTLRNFVLPGPIVTKRGTVDYVGDPYSDANFS